MIPYSPSPTMVEFHADDHFVKGIMGCFASGKSVGMDWDVFLRCKTMTKMKDGVRRSRWALIRNTKEQLKDTTIRTWLDWFPDGVTGNFSVSDMTYHLKYQDIEAEILFRALDRPEDIRKLLSMELTGAFINEAREISWAVVEGLTGRVGRYPRHQEFVHLQPDDVKYNEQTAIYEFPDGREWEPYWSGIIMDTNPPDEDHWWYRQFEERARSDQQVADLYKVFYQPPAVLKVDGKWVVNPKAENLKNLKPNYYLNMVVGKDEEWIKVYAQGQYGIVSEGKPVYSGYSDKIHCAEFEVNPKLPVYVGWDYSFNGQACVLAQLSPAGQLRVFDEFTGERIGLHSFVLNDVKPGITRHGKLDFRLSTGDPAGAKHGDLDEKFALGMLNDAYEDMKCNLPFQTYPADTNSIGTRIEGVNHFLNRLIEGSPALLVHPRCKVLRKGFLGRYEYGRVQVSDEERYKDVPKKNRYSHPQDALQYLCRGILSDSEDEEATQDMTMPDKRSAFSGY